MSERDDFDLSKLVQEAAAGMGRVRVADFADLGSLPPEARKAARILASVNVVADFLAQLTEARPDGDGGLDLSWGEVVKQIGADADPAGWEEIHLRGRRDILTTCAQRLATVTCPCGRRQDDR